MPLQELEYRIIVTHMMMCVVRPCQLRRAHDNSHVTIDAQDGVAHSLMDDCQSVVQQLHLETAVNPYSCPKPLPYPPSLY